LKSFNLKRSRCQTQSGGSHTINKNDRSALSAIAIEAKERINRNLYRTGGQGYHNGKQIEIANKQHHYHCS
jgi:hypothetical protein